MISYFTFGWGQHHEIDGMVFDKDIVVRVDAEDARAVMFEKFGGKWSMEYMLAPPTMSYFPRGIYDLNSGKPWIHGDVASVEEDCGI